MLKNLLSLSLLGIVVMFPACSSKTSGAVMESSDLGNLVYGYAATLSSSLVLEEKNYDSVTTFDRATIFTGSEVTFADLYQSVEAYYLTVKPGLEAAWNIHGDLLHAVYLMNVVHWLWPIGMQDLPGVSAVPVGCVFHNPTLTATDGPVVPASGYHYLEEVTPARYMSSPVACCNDFAMMLYIFLNMAGYQTTQVGRPGHIYVESVIDGDTYILDSMLNYYAKMTNVAILNQTEISTFTLFPFTATQKNKPLYYRYRFGALRSHYIMLSGRAQLPTPITYDVLNHYSDWVTNNRVITGGY